LAELTNYDKVANLIRALSVVKMPPACWTFLFYQMDQQYNWLDKNGDIKNGDNVGYGHMARVLPYSKRSIKWAVKWLEERNIIFIDPFNFTDNPYGNRYHINDNPLTWNIPNGGFRQNPPPE
jgi:hypothetical protein